MAPDRLSLMPDEVLVTILSFLTQKEKVRTSVLSPRFRDVWKHCDKLSIYGNSRNRLFITDYLNHRLTSYRALLLRIFHLRLMYDDYSNVNIAHCLDFVVSRHVEDLLISGKILRSHINIPHSVLHCNSLRDLKICGDSILLEVPPTASLPSLRELEISELRSLSADAVQRLLDASPGLKSFFLGLRIVEEPTTYRVHSNSLENLHIKNGHNTVTSLDVRTPSVKTLKFEDQTFNEEGVENDGQNPVLNFEIMPFLEDASLYFCDIDSQSLLKSIISVKKLSICANRDLHLNNQGVMFDKLQHLTMCHCGKRGIDLHNLLVASPNVTDLTMYKEKYHYISEFNILHAAPEIALPDSAMAKLERVIWTDYSDHLPWNAIMYYILQKGRALRNVDISFSNHVTFKNSVRNDLLMAERASPSVQINVQVIYDEDPDTDSD